MSTDANQEIIKRFRSNTYKLVIQILVTFGISGALGSIIGNYLDKQFNSRPNFLVAGIVISYILAWMIVIKLRKNFKTKSDPLEKQIRNQ